ncbi:alpha/beta hydrolase family protein [Palleronia sp. KMU-117]|uniref:alpha/beta hydrolase family protein n=1 Tax=Palleronia sp. KMU-117 TaxID=3434108 RepID=UPI003D70834D
MGGLTLEMLGDGPVYGPEGGGGLPALVILHGAEGPMAGWSHRFAAILAAQGMLALPVSYGEGTIFGAGPIREVDLRGVVAAGAALAGHPRCGGRVGLLGWSRGGEAAMHVAALGAEAAPFAAIAAHAPADRCIAAFDPVSWRPGLTPDLVDPAAPRAWVWPGREAELVPGREIAVERFAGPMFLSVGDADEIWDHRMTLRLAERRRAAGRPVELAVWPGQGHGLGFDVEPRLWARLGAFFGAHLTGAA